MADWSQVHLADIITIKHGYAFPGEQFSSDPDEPRLVTPGNFKIGGGFKEIDSLKTFSGTYADELVLPPGSVVVTMTDLSKGGDTLGLPAKIPKGPTYLHNQRIGLVQVLRPDAVSADFLHYYLRCDQYRQHILATASGSTVRHTSPKRIGSFGALIPPLAEQLATAEVLGVLDDKIACNAALGTVAFELAKAIFAQRIRVSNFSMQPVSRVATTALGGTPDRSRSDFWSGLIPWVNSGKANERHIFAPSEHITETGFRNSSTKLARSGSTLVAITGATMGKMARLEIDACVNQSIVAVWTDDPPINAWIHTAMLSRKDALLEGATGAAQQHVSKKDVDSLLIPIADEPEFRHTAVRVMALLDTSARAERESHSLADLRDTLLPHLMSGRLHVKDAEKQVEAVV